MDTFGGESLVAALAIIGVVIITLKRVGRFGCRPLMWPNAHANSV